MVSTHLKNISQFGSFPQINVNIKNIWNHQPENFELFLNKTSFSLNVLVSLTYLAEWVIYWDVAKN